MKKYFSILKLVALLVLAPVAIYFLSLSDTLGLYREYRRAKASADIVTVTDDVRDFSASVPLLSSGVLMGMTADLCAENKVVVGHFSPEEVGHEGALHLVSAELKLTGDFLGLLKVLAGIEDIQDIKLSAVKFSAVRLGRNGRTVQLELTVLQLEDYSL